MEFASFNHFKKTEGAMPIFRMTAAMAGLGLMLFSSVQAQMNLSSFSSRAVRSGQTVRTAVDSLLIDTKAGRGLATTRLSLTIVPSGYRTSVSAQETPLDSIEMTLNFSLPSDFVVDSLWLWVNGKPQEAYIQDRALAASQYQQIVGTRRDPALLQYNGNGAFMLRIFPAASRVARKIAIQFHHTFDDDSSATSGARTAIIASLPVTFDTLQQYYIPNYPRQPVNYTRISCTAEDAKQYTLSMPGLGGGDFSRTKSLSISATALCKFEKGTVSTDDPSGQSNKFLFVGLDPRAQKLDAGFSAPLSENSLTFLPEPATRIIVVDMRDSVWNWNNYYARQAAASGFVYTPSSNYTDTKIGERAKKYAILAVQTHVKEDQSFNVIFSGRTVQSVFGAPVKGTADKKWIAITSILDMKFDTAANAVEAVRAAITQAPEGVVTLVSDLNQPPDYYQPNSLIISERGKSFDATLQTIDSLITSVPALTLFCVGDHWKLSSIAMLSGGYTIGGLRNRFAIPYAYTVVDSRRVMLLQLPPFFGSANTSGISRLSITSPDLEELVFSLEANGMYQPYAISTISAVYWPSTYSVSNPLLRVAGRTAIDRFKGSCAFTLSGKLGGLRFIKNFIAATDYSPASADRLFNDVQWPFRKSEWLAYSNFPVNAGAIKQIGKEYHILTRQTSLLALEPGVSLWEDTVNAVTPVTGGSTNAINLMIIPNSSMDRAIGGAPASNSMYGTGFDIDAVSLADIARADVVPLPDNPSRQNVFAAEMIGGNLFLRLPSFIKGNATIALYDLTGRRIAEKIIDASRASGSRIVYDLFQQGKYPARGHYIARLTAGGYSALCKIPIFIR
jgi:hypothetical protein